LFRSRFPKKGKYQDQHRKEPSLTGHLLIVAGLNLNRIPPDLTATDARHPGENSIGSGLRPRQVALLATPEERQMNEEALNATVRKFLKKVGITSQREIEMAVRDAVANGRLKGGESLLAKATIQVEGLELKFEVEGDIELE
jgi:hypothetical protein